MRLRDEGGLQGLANFRSAVSGVQDFVKKSEYIDQVKPKTAIEASGIETFRHFRIMTLDHHIALTLETFHTKLLSSN